MSDKPEKRRREVERIEDWDDARYSHVPPRAATDERLTLAHLRMLILIGKVNTQHGWCQLSQKSTAEMFGMNRQTVNAAVSDLVEWKYVERRTQRETKTSFCHYRVLIDEPAEQGVSPTDDTPQGGGVSPTDDTCVGPGDDTCVVPQATPPISKARAREIKDQRSLPPLPPDGGDSGKPDQGQWKTEALAALRAAGRYREAVEAVLAPLLGSDKRLALGRGAAALEALTELAQSAHGIARPALEAAANRLLASPHKLTPRRIRDEIDRARQGGAMVVIRPGTAQWMRWLDHYEAADPQRARVMARQSSWQVPSEWPPARSSDAATVPTRASGATRGAA